MKRVLIVDKLEDHYHIRELFGENHQIMIDQSDTLEDLRLKLYEITPDVVLYNGEFKGFSLHDLLALLVSTDNQYVPVAFMQDGVTMLPHKHELLFGPYATKIDRINFHSILDTLFRYKELLIQSRELYQENIQLREGILSKEEANRFKTFSFFKDQVIQEFRKAQRFDLSLSLTMVTLDDYENLKRNFPSTTVERFMKALSRSIKDAIRDTDIPMNYDTNKIMILMPMTDSIGLQNAITRIKANIAKTEYHENDMVLKTEAQIGFSVLNPEINTFSEMVKEALRSME